MGTRWPPVTRGGSDLESVTAYKRVRSGGRTLLIYVREECEEIGATYGDWVKVTISKADDIS